ncbi:MAG TPA: hypothetical protein VLM83_06250 [Anaerolineales bacterium]|nr:hypothetical protein [Anaerolineales bacterium]
MTELQVQDKAGKNIKTGLKISLALLILVELVIVGFWISYLTQSNQGLLSVGIISQGMIIDMVKVGTIVSAFGWPALVNVFAILFTALYIRNSTKFPVLPLIFLVGSIGLYIRAIILFQGKLYSWLDAIGIVVAIVVGLLAIMAYSRKTK